MTITNISFEDKLKCKDDILDDPNYIITDIYMITNLTNGKVYVGQTTSHHKNHDRYRPYGYRQRFKDHVSAALTYKEAGCLYLNNSIRLYGADNFMTELICRCDNDQADDKEIYYIDYYDGVYPYGYNLTCGGKYNILPVKHGPITHETTDYVKQPYTHSEETRAKIKLRLKAHTDSPEVKATLSKNTQAQHDMSKLKKFKDTYIDHKNLDQYIHPVTSNETNEVYYFKVFINGTRCDFRSKHESMTTLKERVINFLKQLPSIDDRIPILLKDTANAKIATS